MKMFGKNRVVQVKSKATLMQKEESQSSAVSEDEAQMDSLVKDESWRAFARRHSLRLFPKKIQGNLDVLSPNSVKPLKSPLVRRTLLNPKNLGNLTPKSANMKRVNRSAKGFMVAFPLHDTQVSRDRLKNEEACLLALEESGLPVAKVYTTRGDSSEVVLSEIEGRNALITDWVEGYEADIWKIKGQLGTTIKRFFHEVPDEHREARGQALFDSLNSILDFFERGNCIVDLQVVIESPTGTARIIDPAKIYRGNLPFLHRRRHRGILEDLKASLTLVTTLLKGKEKETPAVEKWSQEELESFWEIECDLDDLQFMAGIWNQLNDGSNRVGKFGEVMERSKVLYREEWEKFEKGRRE